MSTEAQLAIARAVIAAWAESFGVEAVEFHPFLADHFKGDPKVYVAHPDPYMRVKTLEGVMTASRGDWIIRGVKGETATNYTAEQVRHDVRPIIDTVVEQLNRTVRAALDSTDESTGSAT